MYNNLSYIEIDSLQLNTVIGAGDIAYDGRNGTVAILPMRSHHEYLLYDCYSEKIVKKGAWPRDSHRNC